MRKIATPAPVACRNPRDYACHMELTVRVVTRGERPADGTPLVIDVRDTSLMDVAATSVSNRVTTVGTTPDATETDGSLGRDDVPQGTGQGPDADAPLAVVRLEVPDDLVSAQALTVFVHVETTGAREVSAGDLLTVQSYPVHADSNEITVEVVRIG